MRDLPWPPSESSGDIIPGTDRIRSLLGWLGDPQKRLKNVVHVAGTNGKGSTIAFLRRMFEARGYLVNIYTSPHLIHYNERIVLEGSEVSDSKLLEALQECGEVDAKKRCGVSHFEGLTAAAIKLFAQSSADINLIETGMGGRYDATNIFDSVLATIITPISYDHQQFLGNTLTEIALHKAGIMKRGRPCIVSPQLKEVSDVLKKEASISGAILYEEGVDWRFCRSESGFLLELLKSPIMSDSDLKFPNSVELSETTEKDSKSYSRNCPQISALTEIFSEVPYPRPSLCGEHQEINCATAIAAIAFSQGDILGKGRGVADELFTRPIIEHGITSARWAGRMQRIFEGSVFDYIPDSWEIWVDGAHNEGGALALGAWLNANPTPRIVIIGGSSRGRSFSAFFEKINPFLSKSVAVDLIEVVGVIDGVSFGSDFSGDKSINESLSDLSRKEPFINKTSIVIDKFEDAILYAKEILINGSNCCPLGEKLSPGRILITGSLYLVGSFLEFNERCVAKQNLSLSK